ncbi:hypothetical protein [Rhodovulum steppense]|uniref:Lipoprotein n=1 Tax=Rhodovulum steppense TaxID=540251 RepID=A0A4R1Z337_9RHOB|nr:hypothetical protein [Rhodovulum steppense]TCM88080.1 hypothetical protein EV216_10190 [Rhodovulum steppense]
MRLALTLCTVLALTACVPVGPNDAPGAIRTFRGNLVVPDPAIPGQFEVFTQAGDSGADLWCAASEFARDELRVPANRRIYLAAPRGPSATRPGRTSAVFTVSPDADLRAAAEALPDSLTMGVTRPGRNFLPLHGQMACRPLFDLPFDR